MIGKLVGIVDEIEADQVLVDVNGVGYVVHASGRTLSRIGPIGAPVQLYIETVVREDAITLFGFSDRSERQWFRLLTTVQGVGAKVALSIQGVLSVDDLAGAILAQDKVAVTRAPGVGPKLGARIVAELKDKAATMGVGDKVLAGGFAASSAPPDATPGPVADAVSALVNLGYRRLDAFAAVTKAQRDANTPQSVDQLIRAGLRSLSQ